MFLVSVQAAAALQQQKPRPFGRCRSSVLPHCKRKTSTRCVLVDGAREGTRTPKDKPHAPQTCASASSATLAYSVRAALRTSEVGSRLCGLLEYSTTFAGNRQAFFGFFIDFFGVHILIEPTKIQKQHAREVLACVCLYHVCGGCFWGRVSLRVWQLLLRPECVFRRAVRLSAHRRI